jgi:hypothetical protein
VDWSGNTLKLGGIHPQQLRQLFVWSMDDSDLLWYVRSRPCQDYTKGSRTNTVTFSYGDILSEWEQKYPKGEHPREIRNGELICVSLSWIFPSLFGLSSDTEFLYCRRDGDKYRRVLPENGLVGGRDIAEFLNKKAKVISGLRWSSRKIKAGQKRGQPESTEEIRQRTTH